MVNLRTQFFQAFLGVIADVEADNYEPLQNFRNKVAAAIAGMDPVEASEYARHQLSILSPDKDLVALFKSIREFQDAAYGEGFQFAEDHELVTATDQNAIRLSGKSQVPLSFAILMTGLLKSALLEQASSDYLKHFIDRNVSAVNEYRLIKLEELSSAAHPSLTVGGIMEGSAKAQINNSQHEFTLTQQALAIHYLVYEALGVTGIDTTRLIALAHLLGAKKIPQKAGKDNLDNSGIKTAFRNMWQKEDKNHLADLLFVLRFLKPLDNGDAEGIGKAIKSIGQRIEKVLEKLSRNKD